jgi:hypothetical protein
MLAQSLAHCCNGSSLIRGMPHLCSSTHGCLRLDSPHLNEQRLAALA